MARKTNYQRAIECIYQARDKGSRAFSLAGFHLKSLPEEILLLSDCEYFDLSSMGLSDFPLQICKLSNVKTLILSRNKFSRLPDCLSQLKHIETLDFSANRFKEFPPVIPHLKSLRVLKFDHNAISSIEHDFSDVSELNTFICGSNKLREIPSSITRIRNLKALHINDNGIISVDSSLSNLNNLEKFFIAKNKLQSLPDDLVFSEKLTDIDLSENHLRVMPMALKTATGLLRLNISNNKIASMPAWFQSFRNLEGLNMSSNAISDLPNNFGFSNNMRRLYLAKNKLKYVPTCIGNMSALDGLDLSQNDIDVLPQWLGNIVSLQEGAKEKPLPLGGLHIHSNPLSIPYKLLSSNDLAESTENILSWLRGELNPEDIVVYRSENDKEENNVDFLQIVEQRPAAYKFGVHKGKIDILLERFEPEDDDVASDLLLELQRKTEELIIRFESANIDPRVKNSMSRLMDAITGGSPRPGILLSRYRSIEADRDAFDTPDGRAELFPDAISRINDVLLTFQDLLALYPIVRKIEAERLALGIQQKPETLDAIQESAAEIASAAKHSQFVTQGALEALTVNDIAIQEARTLDVRAGLIADKILVVGNFVREGVRASKNATKHTLRLAGSEIDEISRKIWENVKNNLPDGVGDLARILPIAGFAALLTAMLGPVGAIAAFVAAFKPLAGAISKLRSEDLSRSKSSKKQSSNKSM